MRNSGSTPLCRPCAKQRTVENYRAKCRRRRAWKLGAKAEKYTLAEIALRDAGRCQLCHGLVDMELKHPDPWSPTIDHVLPLSRGGDDTRANVWLAHRLCNLRKGNQVAVMTLETP